MSGPAKAQYAPIPISAMGDTRLGAAHHRLLQAIAYHDRFGKNGSGCYATHGTLAEMAKLNRVTVVTALGELVAFGYVDAIRSASDLRKRTYRVIYDGVEVCSRQTTESGASICSPQTTQSRAAETRSVASPEPICSPTCSPETTESVAEQNRDTVESNSLSRDNRTYKRENRSSETIIDSAEAAPAARGRMIAKQAAGKGFDVFIKNAPRKTPLELPPAPRQAGDPSP